MHRARHFRHFFRALVDQQDDQRDAGMIGGDGVGDVLHHDGLAGLGWGNHQAALAFADGRDHVDDPRGDVLFAADLAFQSHVLVGMQRRQVFEENLVLRVFRRLAVDLVDLDQGEIAFAILRRADLAFNGVARVQVETPYLGRADINVVGPGQIGGVRRAQEAETVREHLQRPVTVNRLPFFRAVL